VAGLFADRACRVIVPVLRQNDPAVASPLETSPLGTTLEAEPSGPCQY
jgi:hypothetical protein